MDTTKQFTPKISQNAVLPEAKFAEYVKFMNTQDEAGFTMWDYLGASTLKTANSKKQQKYISESSENNVEVPKYMQQVKILFGGKELVAGYVVPKCYAWDVADPTEFKLDPKAAAAAKTLQAYLTQNPEAASSLPPDVLSALSKLV